MDVSSLNRKVSAAHLPLEKLAGSSQVSEREKLGEVSRQFEAVLLRQILSEAQKPIVSGKTAVMGSSSNAIYQDLTNQQLADHISHGGSFGFANVIEKQLSAQLVKKEAAPSGLKPFHMTGLTALRSTHDLKSLNQDKLKPLDADKSMKDRLNVAPVASAVVAHSTHVRGQPGKRIL